MANIRKKIINKWDGGIKTSARSNNPDTSDGAQLIKGFDVYKDPNKLIPMQSWQDFTTTEEKAYNIRAMGGVGDTVYGVGSALNNWYGQAWQYRLRIDVNAGYLLSPSMPLHLDLSLLPSDFWTHSQSTLADLRVTDKNNNTVATMVENLDYSNMTGDLWIQNTAVTQDANISGYYTSNGEVGVLTQNNSSNYAFSFAVSLSGQTFNYFKTKLSIVGSPGDVSVDLYTDSAGVPGTLVQNLGTINSDYVAPYISATTMSEREFIFNDVVLTGNYHIVLKSSFADANNWVRIPYGNTAATGTVRFATNVGLTSWTLVSNSSPEVVFGYKTFTQPYFYIYYGNSTATPIPHGSPIYNYTSGGRNVFTPLISRWCYTFGETSGGQSYDNKYVNNVSGTTEESFETAPPLVIDGLVGKAISTNGAIMQTDSDDEVALAGNDIAVSLLVKLNSATSTVQYKDTNAGWEVYVSAATGEVSFYVNGDNGNTTQTVSAGLTTGKWYLIDCKYNSNYYIYINGVEHLATDNNGDYDGNPVNDRLQIATSINGYIGLPWGFNNDNITSEIIRTKLYNFTQSDFYTIGSEELKTDTNLQYSGTQLYQKSITSGNWTETLESGRPVRDLTSTPENGFIDDTGSYFVILRSGSYYLAKKDFLEGLDNSYLLLGVPTPSVPTVITSEVATRNSTLYFANGYSTSALSSLTDENVYTVLGSVQSIVSWRTYLAIGYTYRNKGYINIWNLIDTANFTELASTGTGTLRIVGNASDILFAVVDNFIEDAVRSGNKPTMEVKQYVGNGQMDSTHTIEIPAVVTGYTDTWERAVSNFKISRNTQTLFYARLPKDETATTFNEGFWAIGKNSDGQLSLTLQIDTEGLGMPENVFGFAQQVFFIAKDGGIHRLSDNTYNNTALFTTLKMNEGNTEISKKLIGVEVVTEPLEDGQTVSVYYKKNGDTERTKIFDLTGEGEISYETTYDINENNLPHYQEIEFDIESTGGKAGILEFNYKYEYLSNVV